MKRATGGYTIIEVLMVLAVSTALFASATMLFRGKQAEGQFKQAMYDLESKVNLIINEVGVSTFPEAENYDCLRDGVTDRAYLQPTGTPNVTGSNQDCIYLGNAIEARADTTKLVIYPVIGNRTYQSGPTRSPATNFSQTRPTIAVTKNGNNTTPVLVEEHKLGYGVEIVWVCADTNSCPANQRRELAGFYNSLQTSGNPNQYGSQSLFTQSYRFNGSADTEDCVTGNPSCQPSNFETWTMCLSTDDRKNSAILTINTTPSGAGTQLQFKPDPAVCPG